MSGEPKTLTLTPEEILLAARDKDFVLVPTRTVETRELRWSLHKVTVVGSRREIDYLAGFDTLSQAGAWLLGVPVVARDETAELRAALERIADWPDGGNLYGQANIKRFAADTLRRLAGGESER